MSWHWNMVCMQCVQTWWACIADSIWSGCMMYCVTWPLLSTTSCELPSISFRAWNKMCARMRCMREWKRCFLTCTLFLVLGVLPLSWVVHQCAWFPDLDSNSSAGDSSSLQHSENLSDRTYRWCPLVHCCHDLGKLWRNNFKMFLTLQTWLSIQLHHKFIRVNMANLSCSDWHPSLPRSAACGETHSPCWQIAVRSRSTRRCNSSLRISWPWWPRSVWQRIV